MAEPRRTEVSAKAAVVPWTDAEKYTFLAQVMLQTKGYSNNSKVDYRMIVMPHRSKADMKMMWGEMKVEAVFAKKVLARKQAAAAKARKPDWEDTDDEDESDDIYPDPLPLPVLDDKLAAVLQKFPTLPAEMRVKIFGHAMDEPRILEVFFDFSTCNHITPCRFTSREGFGDHPSLLLERDCHVIKWTEKTDDALSASAALLYTNQEARHEFLKKHQFRRFVGGSPVAFNSSQDIIYFGIGTLPFTRCDLLLKSGNSSFKMSVQRIAFDLMLWSSQPMMTLLGILAEHTYEGVTEIIMVIGSELEASRANLNHSDFQRASNSFREITENDVIIPEEEEVKTKLEALWREMGDGIFTSPLLKQPYQHFDVMDHFRPEDAVISDGKLVKLTFMMLERSFDT